MRAPSTSPRARSRRRLPRAAAGAALAARGSSDAGLADAREVAFDTIIDEAPAPATNAATAVFAFHATGADGFDLAFSCRVDDQLFDDCTSPFSVDVADGPHVFSVAAVLRAPGEGASVDPTPAVAAWSLDRVAPDTTLFVGPATVDNAASPRFFFGADEPGVTFLCSLDGADPVECSAPWQVGPLADGTHSVTITAVDPAGNLDPTPLVITWTVDTSLPDTLIDSGPPMLVGATTQQLAFSSPDAGPGASFACSLDGAAAAPCTSPFTPPALASGLHVFQVAVTSAAGTTDPSPATWIWEVDLVAPVLAFSAAPDAVSVDRDPVIEFAATDAHGPISYLCSFDAGPFTPCTSPLTPPTLSLGGHSLDLQATDVVDNLAMISHTWTVTCPAGFIVLGGDCALPWLPEAYVKASNTEPTSPGPYNDELGFATALSKDGNYLAVSSINEYSNATGINGDQSNNSTVGAGAVYVFVRSGATWVQQAYIKAPANAAFNYFGWSLSFSEDGSRLAIGMPYQDVGGTNAGAAYIFTRTGSTWAQEAYLKPTPVNFLSYFGTSIVLSGDGDRVAIGQFLGLNVGVYVFARAGATWTQEARLQHTASDEFGWSVAMSADGARIAVGARIDDGVDDGISNGNGPAGGVGVVYVHDRSGTTWSETAILKASNFAAKDFFGASVGMSPDGARLVVGAPGEDSAATGVDGDAADNTAASAGAAYVFDLVGGIWTQSAYLKASNAEAGDQFGLSISLSADGARLVVGAPYEDGAEGGVNASQASNDVPDAGAVYVFALRRRRLGPGGVRRCPPRCRRSLRHLAGLAEILAVGALGEDSVPPPASTATTTTTPSNAGALHTLTLNQ
ncbi:MAG: hypothetical protein R2939_04950 [Kofleriaceae bacterium]